MSIRESALDVLTSIQNSDLIRLVTSSGGSRKITLANLGAIIARKISIDTSATDLTSGSLQAQINSLNSKTNFRKASITSSAETINANSAKWITVPLPARGTAISISGYYIDGNSFCAVYAMELTSSGVTIAIRNHSTTSSSITVQIHYLVVE